MTSYVYSALAPGQVSGGSLTLADLMALPSVTDLITAGKALGIGRTKSYELVREGTFPCPVITVGRTYRVPTADLLALLGLSLASSRNQPDTVATATHHTGKPPQAAARVPGPARTSQRHNGPAAQHGEGTAPTSDPGREELTAAGWLEEWLSRARLRETTRRSYRGHLRNHLRPRLPGVLLADVDVAALERLFTAMVEDGVSDATVRRVYCTIRSALNAAVRERLISDNPARYLQVPAGRRPHAVIWTSRRVKHWRRTRQVQRVNGVLTAAR